MIAVVDYDTGNLRSVDNAFRRIGVEAVFTDDHSVIRSADRVLLPGWARRRRPWPSCAKGGSILLYRL